MQFQHSMLVTSIVLQAVSALFTDFTNDSHEAGNSWEPLHFLLYGKGLQTWEWNRDFALRSPFQPIVLAGLGEIFKLTGMPRYCVFYCIRLVLGIIGSFGVFYLYHAVRKKFGEFVATMSLILIVFNYHVLYFMNRVSLDSTIAVLNLFIFGMWLNNHVFLVMFFSVLTAFLRVNYLPVFGIIMLQILFSWEERKMPFTEWVIQLFLYLLSITLFWLGVLLAVDSFWYRRPTLAFLNLFVHNVIKDSRGAFGVHSPLKYLECLFRENNAIAFSGAALGLYVSPPRSRMYALPYLCTFVYLQLLSHKQDRYLYFFYPIICLYCSICIFWLVEFSLIIPPSQCLPEPLKKPDESDAASSPAVGGPGDKRPNGRVGKTRPQRPRGSSSGAPSGALTNGPANPGSTVPNGTASLVNGTTTMLVKSPVPASGAPNVYPASPTVPSSPPPKLAGRAVFIFLLLGFYVLSGMSTTFLRVYQHSTHFYFFEQQVSDIVAIDSQGKECNCLSTNPWASWWLPLSCKKIYTIQLSDEFFRGYNRASFLRFEDPRESALVAYQNSSKLYLEEQVHWDDVQLLRRIHDWSRSVNWTRSTLHREAMCYVLLEGGVRIPPRQMQQFQDIAGRSIRHKLQSTSLFFYEVLLGDYLANNYELTVEANTLARYEDVPALARQTGYWFFGPGSELVERAKATTLAFWRLNR